MAHHPTMSIRARLNQSFNEMVEQDPKRDEVILSSLTLLTSLFMALHIEALHKSSPLYKSLTQTAPWQFWVVVLFLAGFSQMYAAVIWRNILARNVAALVGAFLWTVVAIVEYRANLTSWVMFVSGWMMIFQTGVYFTLKDAPPYGALWLERRDKARRVLRNIEHEI